jgi:hypothetical protein
MKNELFTGQSVGLFVLILVPIVYKFLTMSTQVILDEADLYSEGHWKKIYRERMEVYNKACSGNQTQVRPPGEQNSLTVVTDLKVSFCGIGGRLRHQIEAMILSKLGNSTAGKDISF